jgi:hypothetical protein
VILQSGLFTWRTFQIVGMVLFGRLSKFELKKVAAALSCSSHLLGGDLCVDDEIR